MMTLMRPRAPHWGPEVHWGNCWYNYGYFLCCCRLPQGNAGCPLGKTDWVGCEDCQPLRGSCDALVKAWSWAALDSCQGCSVRDCSFWVHSYYPEEWLLACLTHGSFPQNHQTCPWACPFVPLGHLWENLYCYWGSCPDLGSHCTWPDGQGC